MMKDRSGLRNILLFITMPILGFILLNLTFILDFLFQSIIQTALQKIFTIDYNKTASIISLIIHVSFALFILAITWLIFSTKIKDLYKAVFLPVPVAVVLVTEGMLLHRWSAVVYAAGILSCGIFVLFLYMTKKSWHFYYSVSWVAVILFIMGFSGMDI